MVRSPDAEEPTRFLVSMLPSDIDRIDTTAKQLRMSRSRFILIAALKYIQDLPAACPICGKTETHAH